MKTRLDSTDERLVRLLGHDARQDSEELGKQLNLSASTVRRRLRKLIQGRLVRIIGVVDPSSIGLQLSAMICFDVAHDKMASAMEELGKLEEIGWMSATTGRYDMVAFGLFRSADHLADFTREVLPKIEGIKDTETFVCLDWTKKGQYVPIQYRGL